MGASNLSPAFKISLLVVVDTLALWVGGRKPGVELAPPLPAADVTLGYGSAACVPVKSNHASLVFPWAQVNRAAGTW